MKKILYTMLVIFSLTTNAEVYKNEHHGHNHIKENVAAIDKKYRCPMHPEIIGQHKDNCSICGMWLTEPVQKDSNIVTDKDTHVCPMHSNITGKEGDKCSECGMFLEPKIEKHKHATSKNIFEKKEKHLKGVSSSNLKNVFVCPMHPEIISDIAGTCPICGMNLELKEVKSQLEINVSGQMQQALGVRTEIVKRKDLSKNISTFGEVKYNENNIYTLYPRIEGWIKNTIVKSIGDYVKKGDVLFYVYSPELVQAQEDFLVSLNSKDEMLINLSKKRLFLLGFNEHEIKELTLTKQSKTNVPIFSEYNGYVTNIDIKNGAFISKQKELIKIVDLSSVWIIANIFPKDVKWLKNNSIGTISNESILNIKSEINYIYPEINPVTRTWQVRFELKNNGEFKPQDYVNVNIEGKTIYDTIFIPTEALIQTEKENRVIVQKDDSTFTVKSVTVGEYANNQVSIVKGLKEGEKVVVSGQFLIDSEASMQGGILRLGDSYDN